MPAESLAVTPSLLRYLGLGPADQRALEQLGPILAEAAGLVDTATWRARLDLGQFLGAFAPWAGQSRALAKLLAGCGAVHLLAASLGPGLEGRARQCLAQRQAFKGYVLDRLGSYLVEQAVRGLDRQIKRELAAQGARATHRYSPGYGDFPLEAQASFLPLMAPHLPGLSLSPGGIIHPEKTVTALLGEFPPGP